MKKNPKKRTPLPMLKGKRPPSYRAEEVGISLRPQWDLDELIDECNILLQVCTRLRDHRLHNKRCCMNCKFLATIRNFTCEECGEKIVLTRIKFDADVYRHTEDSKEKAFEKCYGELKPSGVPDRYLCINEKVVALMENPMEFDFDGDIRTFHCPFFGYSEDSTNIVKYKELKKLLQT